MDGHSLLIAQNVYYADSTFCDPSDVDPHSGYPSRPTGDDGYMKPWLSPFILMVDRGTCSFVQKVSGDGSVYNI
jgi:hypothetical protein